MVKHGSYKPLLESTIPPRAAASIPGGGPRYIDDFRGLRGGEERARRVQELLPGFRWGFRWGFVWDFYGIYVGFGWEILGI